MKLLVVDDDPGVVEMLRDYLSARSFNVLTAARAREALHLAFHEKPDTVILDLTLPDFSGEEVLLKIKEKLPGTHVLILTGRNEPGLETKLRELGCDSFLQKGSSLASLEQILLNWS